MRIRIISSVIILSVLISLLAPLGAAWAQDMEHVVYDSDFSQDRLGDKPTSGTWIVAKNAGDRTEVVKTETFRTFKIAKNGAGAVANSGAMLYFPKQAKKGLTAEMTLSVDSENGNYCPMYLLSDDGAAMLTCTFAKGNIGIYVQGQWRYVKAYETNTPYTIRAEIDLETHRFDFYVNGEQMVSQEAMRNTVKDNIGILNSYITTPNSAMYIRSIRITAKALGEDIVKTEPEEAETVKAIDYSDNAVVLSENFNEIEAGEIPGGYWRREITGGGEIGVTELGGEKVMRISKAGTDSRGECGLYLEFPLAVARVLGTSVVTVEYRFRNDDAIKFNGAPYIYSMDGSPALTVGFGNNGMINMNASSNVLGPYSQGTWYNMKFVMDYNTKKLDAYINGELIKSNENFRGGTSTNLKTIKFYIEYEGAVCFLDDLVVTSSNHAMPEAYEAVPALETQISGDKEHYTITRDYVNARRAIKPPVLLDTLGLATQEFLVKSDAAAALLEQDEDLTIRSQRMRIKIPANCWEGLSGEDCLVRVSKADANALFHQIEDNTEYSNTGIAYSVELSTPSGAVDRVGDGMEIKVSECFDFEQDPCLAFLRVDSNGSTTHVVGRQDLFGKGIWFKTHRTGDYIAVRVRRDFADVPAGWQKDAVQAAYARGIAQGREENAFVPEGTLTRGELAKMMDNAVDLPAVRYDSQFMDIQGAEFYAGSVAALFDLGVIERSVYGDRFLPAKAVTRGELAYMLSRLYLILKDRDSEEATKFYVDGSLTDIEGEETHIYNGIRTVQVLSIMNGRDGSFRPEEAATRAETAQAMLRLCEALGYLDIDTGTSGMKLTDLFAFPFTYKSYYTYISGSSLENMNENGAYGENAKYETGESERWYIEEQRNIDADIMTEVVRKRYLGERGGDPALCDRLVKAFDWGFSKQDSSGGFEGSSDEYHGAGFFLEEVGRLLALWQESGDPQYDPYFEKYLQPFYAGIKWMTSDTEFDAYYNSGLFDVYTHRYFYYGAAFTYCGMLTGDEAVKKRVNDLLLEGISHMTKEGTLPEKGGFDLGYGVTSIGLALRCLAGAEDPMLRSELKDMLVTATTHIITKMDNKGNIDTSDSTRTNGQEVKRDGVTPKVVSERSFYNTLLAMASVTGRGDIIKARDQMAVRQVYLTKPYIDGYEKQYLLDQERFDLPDAQPTGNKNQMLSELPVKAVEVSEQYGKTSAPEKMFDGDLETGWYARKFPQYAQADLGSVTELGRVELAFGAESGKQYTYSILVSEDGEHWAYAAKDIASKHTQVNAVEFPYVKARYVRVWISGAAPYYQTMWFTDIRELKFYGIYRDSAGEQFEPLNPACKD